MGVASISRILSGNLKMKTNCPWKMIGTNIISRTIKEKRLGMA